MSQNKVFITTALKNQFLALFPIGSTVAGFTTEQIEFISNLISEELIDQFAYEQVKDILTKLSN